MAQQIVTLCDPCLLADGKESPAVTWTATVAAPGTKPVAYEIDVCEGHADRLGDLGAFLVEYGHRADRGRPLPTPATARQAPTEDHVCPICRAVLGSAGSLNGHVRSQHGQTMAEATGTPGIACLVDDCGRLFTGYQGVASHLRSVHGWASPQISDAIRDRKAAAHA